MCERSPPRTIPGILAAAAAVFILLCPDAVGQDQPEKEARYSIGAGLLWHSAGTPLDAGAGLALRYSRDMQNWPVDIRAGLAFFSLDREAEGEAREGELDGVHLWVGIARSLKPSLSFVAGLDFVSPDAAGTYLSSQEPIGVRNDYDADAGVGAHAGIEFVRKLGKRGEFFADLRYMVMSLDGEHRYVIDGIEGDPVSVDFKLGGPRLTVGFARRF